MADRWVDPWLRQPQASRHLGPVGLGAAVAIWGTSVWELASAMRVGLLQLALERRYGLAGHGWAGSAKLDATGATLGAIAAALQIVAVLLGAWTLHSVYRLRSPVAVAIAAGAAMAGDALGFFALLLWLWITVGVH